MAYNTAEMSKKRGTSEEKVAAASSSTAPAAKAARKETRGLFERSRVQPIPMRDGDDPTDYVKILSWNVAGLRSYYNNHKGDVLKNLLEKHSPDILILQETKLQVTHVDEAEAFFTSIGYKGYWACSIAKKGYAGTALLVKNDTATDHVDVVKIPEQKSNAGSKQKKMNSFSSESAPSPMQASTGSNGTGSNDTGDSSKKWTLQKVTVDLFGDADAVHGGEGRIICAELDSFFLVACYVPNSGMDLSRLDYRTKQWDPFIRKYLDRLRSAKPVIFAGDLNVGHLDLDIYNFTAKHIHKQAGLTPQERASHGKLLAEGYIDALRFFYPGKFAALSIAFQLIYIYHSVCNQSSWCANIMIFSHSCDVYDACTQMLLANSHIGQRGRMHGR